MEQLLLLLEVLPGVEGDSSEGVVVLVRLGPRRAEVLHAHQVRRAAVVHVDWEPDGNDAS